MEDYFRSKYFENRGKACIQLYNMNKRSDANKYVICVSVEKIKIVETLYTISTILSESKDYWYPY